MVSLPYTMLMIRDYKETTEFKVKQLLRSKEQASENNKPKFDLAINLVLLRQSVSKGQLEVAKALGVDQKNVSQWENAEVAPSLRYLIALAKFFRVTIDRLLVPFKEF